MAETETHDILQELAVTLREQIEEFQPTTEAVDVGTVIEVGDGIARASGLTNVRMSELVEFEGGVPGIAFNLEDDNVGIIVTGDYTDIEDFCAVHVVFEDGTVADIFSCEIVMGGIHNWLEVAANNHRTLCNINPNTAMQTYNPADEYFRDIYVVEKIGTKQGWSTPSPDEDWFTGYPQEMEAFYRTIAYDDGVESDSRLAGDAISTIYSGYVSAQRNGAEVPVRAF